MTTEMSKKVLEKIKKGNVVPIPKWHFLLKDAFVWGMAGTSVLFGAFAVAIGLHQLSNKEDIPFSRPIDFFSFIPYVWLILLLIFVYVAYHNYLHTEQGYRYKTATILAIAISTAVVLGSILGMVGIGGRMNAFLASRMPYYSHYADRRSLMWQAPEEGRIAGRILAIDARSNTFTLQDLNGQRWIVSYEEGVIRPTVQLKVGEVIKILGATQGHQMFKASDIRPWVGGGMNPMQGNVKGIRITR